MESTNTQSIKLTTFIEDIPAVVNKVMEEEDIMEIKEKTPIHVRVTHSVRQLGYGALTMTMRFWTDDGRVEEVHMIMVRSMTDPDDDEILYCILNGSGSGFEPLYFKETNDPKPLMDSYLPSIIRSTISKLIRRKVRNRPTKVQHH